MSSIHFPSPIPPDRAQRLEVAAGVKVTHDGQTFLFDGAHILERLGKRAVLIMTVDLPCPYHIRLHEEGDVVTLRIGVYKRRGDQWVTG